MSRLQPYLIGLLAFASLVSLSQDESGLPDEWIEDPEKMIFEAMAFDADIAIKRYISRHPSAYKDALEKYAEKELPPLSQVRLVEIAYFVFDDEAFNREANEALEVLRQGDTEHPSTAHLIQSMEKLVAAKTQNLEEEGATVRNDSATPERAITVTDQSGEPSKSIEDSPTSASSPVWPYLLVAVAVLGIVVILLRSRKTRKRR